MFLFPRALAAAPVLAALLTPCVVAQEKGAGDEGVQAAKVQQGPSRLIDVRTWPPARPPADESDVAFRFELEGQPVKPVVITMGSWTEYLDAMAEIYKPKNLDVFRHRIFVWRMEEVLARMHYHEKVPLLREKARQAWRRLDRGTEFERVVRQFSDDIGSKADQGVLGALQRVKWRYPVDLVVFDAEVGEVVGPVWTEWGVEFFRIDHRKGERRTQQEVVSVSNIIMLYWEPGESFKEAPNAFRHLRVSSPHPDLAELIPPGMLPDWPESFGPTDLLPLGGAGKIATGETEKDSD